MDSRDVTISVSLRISKADWLDAAISKKQMDFEQILLLAMWMPTTSYSLGVHHIKIRSADIKSAYLQGKQNDRIILYRVPKGGIPEEGVAE